MNKSQFKYTISLVSSAFPFSAIFFISLSLCPPCLSFANLNQSFAIFSISASVAADENLFFLTEPLKIKEYWTVLDPINVFRYRNSSVLGHSHECHHNDSMYIIMCFSYIFSIFAVYFRFNLTMDKNSSFYPSYK